jgi:hypothetical protein
MGRRVGLLDELKQQAESLRQKQQVKRQSTQEEIEQNLQLMHARFNDALHYWKELFDSLNAVKPVISRYYYLEGATQLENLLQCDYQADDRRLTVDQKDYTNTIVLRFHCAADRKITIEKQMAPVVQRTRDHLWMHNLTFDLKETRNVRGYVERGIFTVSCRVPVLITIVANIENSKIKITTKNLEKLGEYTYTYDFDEFGKELQEELAKVILAKPNTFRAMGKHQQALRTATARARPESDGPAAS